MSRSQALFEEAQRYIPGGVNSPVRAFHGVGGTPIFFHHAQGPYLFDEDKNKYVDYVGAFGPMILGHQNAQVIKSIEEALHQATAYGAPTAREIELAKLICEVVPGIEQVRMVNSGTEATMTALRLARGFTGKDLIIKFEGCYHGHSDSLLIKAGSGPLTLGQPSSPGIPESIAQCTLNLEFNNSEAVYSAFSHFGDRIAAVIVEPIAGNMGCILPEREFLLALRQACTNHGAVLIFDEIITGFRVGLQGAQGLYQIQPDLSTFGKIIGGGLPVGAIAGKRNIMSFLAPNGPVYQAGTLSGNPLAMAAGLATLTQLKAPQFYEQLKQSTIQLVNGLKDIAKKHHVPTEINWQTGMFSLFFNANPVKSFQTAMQSDIERFKRFYHGMLNQGIYLGPSAFECAFVSITHDQACIDQTLKAADKVFATLT